MAAIPVAAYGVSLLAAAFSWWLMQTMIVRLQGPVSPLRAALGRDSKGNLTPLMYISAIGLAFAIPVASYALYAAVAAIWLVPDRRIGTALKVSLRTPT